MWGQLRKNLGENVIQKIGEVVAPPPDDSQSESDSEGGYGEDDHNHLHRESDGEASSEDIDNLDIHGDTSTRVGIQMREVGKIFGGVLKRALNEVNHTSRTLLRSDDQYEYYDEGSEEDRWSEEEDVNFDNSQDSTSFPIESLPDHLDEWNTYVESPRNGFQSETNSEQILSLQNETSDINKRLEVQKAIRRAELVGLAAQTEVHKLRKQKQDEDKMDDSQTLMTIQEEQEAQRIQEEEVCSVAESSAQILREAEEAVRFQQDDTRTDTELEIQRMNKERDVQLTEQALITIEHEARKIHEEQARIHSEVESQRLDQVQETLRKEKEQARKVVQKEPMNCDEEQEAVKLQGAQLAEEARIEAMQESRFFDEKHAPMDVKLVAQGLKEEQEALRMEGEQFRPLAEIKARTLKEGQADLQLQDEDARIEAELELQNEQARITITRDALRIDEHQDQIQPNLEMQTLNEEYFVQQAQIDADLETQRINPETTYKEDSVTSIDKTVKFNYIESDIQAHSNKKFLNFDSGHDSIPNFNNSVSYEECKSVVKTSDDHVDSKHSLANSHDIEGLQDTELIHDELLHGDMNKEENILLMQKDFQEILDNVHNSFSGRLTEYENKLLLKEEELQQLQRKFEVDSRKIEERHSIEIHNLQTENQGIKLDLNNTKNSIVKLEHKHLEHNRETERMHKNAISNLERKLDSKVSEISRLKTIIKNLEDDVKTKAAEHAEVDEEADELHQENEELLTENQKLKDTNDKLQQRIIELEANSSQTMGFHIEIQLLKEERDRLVDKLQTLEELQINNGNTLRMERDAALAQVRDMELRTKTLQADLEVARADYSRAMLANTNLQSALETIQLEREAEISILEDTRRSSEEAMIASHTVVIESMKQECKRHEDEIKIASNKAINEMMNEIAAVEKKHEIIRKENVNLRRSLDEAIHQLQTGKEDVIDRSLMKSILLDWYSKSGKSKNDVMMVISSVLHFSEEEKAKCGLSGTQSGLGGVIGFPQPHPSSPIELAGDSVREKFVSFLLAECGDTPESRTSKRNATTI